MTRKLRIFQVDAFTKTPFTGNPATVVLDGDGLTDDQMRRVAREFAKGDTAFVLPATSFDHDLTVRFFMPHKEAPFVGHATLAVHAVLARQSPLPLRRQAGRSGIVEVRSVEDGSFAISQPPPVLTRELEQKEIATLMPLLGLTSADLDPSCPPRVAGTASTRLLLALRNVESLNTARPQLAQLASMSSALGAQGYFLFARDSAPEGCLTESRMFCPALGIDEDPVSGNAHAMLAMQLLEKGLLPVSSGKAEFTGAQGRHVGRPGRVKVAVELNSDFVAQTVSISGHAVIMLEGSAYF